MTESDDEKLLIAKALKEAGLIAITSLSKASDLADISLEANNDADIPQQTKTIN